MGKRTLAILNPRSGAGRAERRFARLEPRLRELLGDVEVERTRAPRDAERIAREAVRAGIERVLVGGGDGTLAEVASGLLAAGLGGYAEIGLLPLGTGSDFPRTLALPRDPARLLEALAEESVRRIDAGRARYRGRDGEPRETWFVNLASFGISGHVTEQVNRGPKALGGRLAFLLGTLRGIASHRSLPVRLLLDGEPLYEGPLVLGAAANGRYFGGGMQVAPDARPDDGLLDVVVVGDISRVKLLRELPRIYRGTHLAVAGVHSGRGRVLEAETDGPVPLELDGDPLGRLPARIEIVPDALALIGASSAAAA